jgi:hypothetical protein
MIAATVGKFEVECFHNHQLRKMILTVVHTETHGDLFFLVDLNDYAVDDVDTLINARHQYATGIAKEIDF